MPSILTDPAERLLSFLELPRHRTLVALTGVPGSGKSTLAVRLSEEVNARAGAGTMIALGMDGFHLSRAALRQLPDPEEAFARRGAPWTFDPAALAARLQALRDAAGSHAVAWPGFEHDVGDPVEGAQTIGPLTRLVLVEGLYLLHRVDGWESVSQLFDEGWFLDTPLDVALERLAARHVAAWGLSHDAAWRRIAANDRLNAEIVTADRDCCDWLVIPEAIQGQTPR